MSSGAQGWAAWSKDLLQRLHARSRRAQALVASVGEPCRLRTAAAPRGGTLINVLTVDPERQEALVDALSTATVELFVDIPGFVSANLHASLDGKAVINYAQWGERGRRHDDAEQPRALWSTWPRS